MGENEQNTGTSNKNTHNNYEQEQVRNLHSRNNTFFLYLKQTLYSKGRARQENETRKETLSLKGQVLPNFFLKICINYQKAKM